MLTQLTIRNFGLIDDASIEFTDKLNILTGETGAGKSILIDALRSVLGERLDPSSIRNPQNPCLIEAVFDITDKKLRESELIKEFSDENHQIIVQRTLSAEGKNKIKINGLTATVGQLKNLGDHLIDFHGPHDHQMLLSEEEHLAMLDQLVDFKNIKEDYAKIFTAFEQTRKNLESLNALAQSRQRDLDLLSHQVKELEALPLSDEKYEALLQEETKLNNAERLHEHIQNLLESLDDEETGANTLLRKAFSPLKSLTQIDEKSSGLLDKLSVIQEETNDLISQLNDYAAGLEFDEQTALRIHGQMDAYADIKRKYGPSLTECQNFYAGAKTKLDLIKDFEHNDQKLRETLESQEKELSRIGQKMTRLRQKAAEDLKTTIEHELKELGILHVKFEVRFEKAPFNRDGQDKTAFYISPNAGEDLKPLAQIISSGEAARVMLALKKALVLVDPIPVLIFDEIDAQIGGRLGTVTGKKLKELSQSRQVILITHLPQIASFADRHFKVSKSVKTGRAATDVFLLEGGKRVEEIAQMMSGANATKISISHAQDMLSQAK
ncbi:MAG: DNA repair protein RecN [Candidatus Omnitrophica bacterium]|nr:DNA repair protein RecN [Candidatus Omnitrophota bacterium]MDE2008873.1 DNA repair protein RecN [Candidatus Omnitrophota bacterium]MDE2213564.1 DNA repair protein RecN [Candidatus Omnitrophota bacterium]MDE2230535.1 DNA repair protein RecN [Candidatus Omnitrophota bacterium]